MSRRMYISRTRSWGSSFCCNLLLQCKTSICFYKQLKPKESSRIKSRIQHLLWQPLFKVRVDSVTMISWAREILASRPKEISHVIYTARELIIEWNPLMFTVSYCKITIRPNIYFSQFCELPAESPSTPQKQGGRQLQRHGEYSSVHSQDGR